MARRGALRKISLESGVSHRPRVDARSLPCLEVNVPDETSAATSSCGLILTPQNLFWAHEKDSSLEASNFQNYFQDARKARNISEVRDKRPVAGDGAALAGMRVGQRESRVGKNLLTFLRRPLR
jgi:hypothetical protein